MGWIDVAIPGAVGLWVVLLPQTFVRASGNAIKDTARIRKLRFLGLGLFVVAAVYAAIKVVRAA